MEHNHNHMGLVTRFWLALSEINSWIGGYIETQYLNSIPGFIEEIKKAEKGPFTSVFVFNEDKLERLLHLAGFKSYEEFEKVYDIAEEAGGQ